jgi:hypothetical protein
MNVEERIDIIRKNRQFPIYVWGYKTSEENLEIASNVLRDVLESMGMRENFPIYVFPQEKFGDGDWGSAAFYFENPSVRKRGEQYCAIDVLDLCKEEPWQKTPHIEFIVSNVDLWSGDENNNFVFGLTFSLLTKGEFGSFPSIRFREAGHTYSISLFPGCILSTYRMRSPSVFYLLLLHETFHLFGVPAYYRRKNVEKILGLHCKLADCAMSQVAVNRNVILPNGQEVYRYISPEETWKYVNERYNRTGKYFCEDCEADLYESKEILLRHLFS